MPLKGEKRDGHEFVFKWHLNKVQQYPFGKRMSRILRSNLPLIIVEDTLEALQQLAKSYRDQLDRKVVAITGSNGKTTTKDILAGIIISKI